MLEQVFRYAEIMIWSRNPAILNRAKELYVADGLKHASTNMDVHKSWEYPTSRKFHHEYLKRANDEKAQNR